MCVRYYFAENFLDTLFCKLFATVCYLFQGPAQYIRYTPSQQGAAFNSGAKQRVIRMVEAQKDPIEPPKFK